MAQFDAARLAREQQLGSSKKPARGGILGLGGIGAGSAANNKKCAFRFALCGGGGGGGGGGGFVVCVFSARAVAAVAAAAAAAVFCGWAAVRGVGR